MRNNWYVRVGDRTIGPATTEQVLDALNRGKIARHHLIRRDGENAWREIADVPAITGEPVPPASPVVGPLPTTHGDPAPRLNSTAGAQGGERPSSRRSRGPATLAGAVGCGGVIAAACVATIAVAFAARLLLNPEEECNQARVTAHDAWVVVDDGLRPQCTFFQTEFWRDNGERAHDAVGRLAMGRASNRDMEAIDVELSVESYRPALIRACRAVGRAKQSATEGAIAARDASNEARDAVRNLSTQHAGVLATLQERAERGGETRAAAASAFEVHSHALTSAELGQLVDAADSAAQASWVACQTVAP